MTKLSIITKTEAETKQLAETLASFLKAGDVLTLSGDLGVGKTTFTKGLAIGLGITAKVTSPTFTIMKQYEGNVRLNHMDVYRLEHAEEDIGFDEYFYGDGVTVVEWAQFIADFLPDELLEISLERLDDTVRKITFVANGLRYEKLLEQLENLDLRSFEDDNLSNRHDE